jgi:eukaryotic-like serine/threonine-protein kinase
MNKKSLLFFPFLGLLLYMSCASTFKLKKTGVGDIPGWKSFRGDAQNTGFISTLTPPPDKLLWKYDLNRSIKSTPIIVGGRVVVGSLDKKLDFIDAVSGKELGYYKISSLVSTSPCGDEETIYFGWFNVKESFYALNLPKKQVRWKVILGDISAAPTLKGDKVFVGTGDGSMWALEKTTGRKIWQFKSQNSILSTPAFLENSTTGENDSSSLNASEEMAYFGSTDGFLYALLAKSGKLNWKFKADGGIYSSPAIHAGMIFFGSVDGCLYALNLKDGTPAWKFRTGEDIYSSPAVTESLVYIGSNDYCMYAVNQKTGELSWKFKTGGLIHSSPIVVGDALFFGSYDGNFYVLNRFSGDLIWKYQTKGMISSSPAYYDGKIYIGSEDGYLYSFGR